MKKNMTMKKTYIRPFSQDLSFRTEGMLAASPGVNDSQVTTGNKSDDDYEDYGSQFSSHRSWSSGSTNSTWE